MKKNNLVIVVILFLTYHLSAQEVNFESVTYNLKPKIYLLDTMSIHTHNQMQIDVNRFSTNNLPIFCKIEHQWSKASNINIRMRLGSLDYVDYLENK